MLLLKFLVAGPGYVRGLQEFLPDFRLAKFSLENITY